MARLPHRRSEGEIRYAAVFLFLFFFEGRDRDVWVSEAISGVTQALSRYILDSPRFNLDELRLGFNFQDNYVG